ncbi:crustacyanin-C1 subunit-like [Symsagittifera roscoffensis]|uniref:crustacyanin-C1 subunit-like n=1 Tax=Symsagittifera roscoffensis TaxID=84072 RepID=UPI00307BE30D
MDNFKLGLFVGIKWHQIAAYPSPHTIGCSCLVNEYTEQSSNETGTYLSVKMTYMKHNRSQEASLPALYPSEETKAQFIYAPEDNNNQSNVFYLDIDYEEYALSYSCEDTVFGRYEYAAIYSRTDTLADEVFDMLKGKLEDIGSDMSKFREPQHEGCPTENKTELSAAEI